MKRKNFILDLVFLAIFGFLVYCFCWSRNYIIVANNSGLPISSLNVMVGGRTIIFRDIAAGDEVSSTFKIKGDDHFEFGGKLADGTRINGSCGYVTNGMYAERMSFQVRKDGSVDLK